jgi:3-mercaptopyruvate sulfurtransferase SseA
MAAGILERKGFKMPRNLKGGSQAWITEGLPVYEASKERGARSMPAPAKKPAKPVIIDEGC